MLSTFSMYAKIIRKQCDRLLQIDDVELSTAQQQAVEVLNRQSTILRDVIGGMYEMTEHERHAFIRHDLLNTVTPLKGYAEMLDEGWLGGLSDDQKEVIGMMAISVRELIDSIHDYRGATTPAKVH